MHFLPTDDPFTLLPFDAYAGNEEIGRYPNHAKSEVTITTTEPASLQFMDLYGRIMINHGISDKQNIINISALPSGILIFVFGDQRYLVRRM